MKKVLLLLYALAALGAAALAVFLARFDADRFRPAVIQKMEAELGRPVRLGRISLGWRRGIALELPGLAIYPGPEPEGEPAVRVERVFAVLKVFPLLRGDVQLATLSLIGPSVHVVRTPAGSIDVEGVTPLPARPAPAAAAQAKPTPSAPARPHSFLIRYFELKEGRIRFTDLSAQPPLELELRDVELGVTNISPSRPADFEGRLTLFSGRPNVRAKGRITPPAAGRPGLLESFRLETDLADLRVEEVRRLFPAFREGELGKEVEGKLVAVVDRLVLDPDGIGSAEAQIRLSGGGMQPARMAAPLKELEFEAVVRGGKLALNAFSGKVGQGSFSARGNVQGLAAQPVGTIQGKAEGLALEELLAPGGPGEPALRGRFSGSLSGDFQGKSWPEISRSLGGEGRIRLENGILSDMNLLREVFDRLTLIPGLTATLLARLPDSYRRKLSARDTRFEPIELSGAAKGGVLSFRDARVATDSFTLTGSGQLDLEGNLQFPARVEIEPQLSAALIGSVEELRYLADGEGRVVIPIILQGKLPRVSAIPDLGYVAAQLAASKGQELIGELLQKVFEKE
ncbi:MAG: AsmA family protein [Candidatus Omnitrophica bacterium]|nr:AsmA family protein [Candidatus Omnitrophota bacterium]